MRSCAVAAKGPLVTAMVLIASTILAAENTLHPSDLLFSYKLLPEVEIDLDKEAIHALYLHPRIYVDGTARDRAQKYEHIGIHLKGQYGTFQGMNGKPSLTLNFDKFVPGQRFHGLDKLHLNNSVSDPAYTTELLCRELFRTAGVPTSRATHARLKINGRDAGFYVLAEGYDKTFLRQYFTNANGNLYDSEFRHDINNPLKKSSGNGPDDHSDLKRLVMALEEPDHGERIRKLSSSLDLNRFYSFLAMELITCHFDGYARSVNNYRVYHDPDSGKWVFMPTGMDQMFYNPQSSLFPDLKGMLADALLNTSEGRKKYRQRCVVLFTNLFPKLSNQVEEVRQRIRPVIAECGINAAVHHDQAVANLQRRIAKRTEHLCKHLLVPIPGVLILQAGGEAVLTNWLWNVEEGTANMNSERATNGVRLLQTHLEPTDKPAIATWEHRLLLTSGLYRISAAVKANEAIFRGPDCPISVKVWGGTDTGFESIRKDRQNVHVARSFVVSSTEPEDVLIQFEASSAELPVTFEFSTLILMRLQ